MSLRIIFSRWLPALSIVVVAAFSAFGLDGRSIVRLKRAGVSDETIERLIAERTIETAAFSVDEIIAMKSAGVGEKTLQALISEGSFLKDREPMVYGRDLRSLRLATAADIIELKQAGVSDEVLRAVVAASRPAADSDRQEALRLLSEMGIWVERRDARPAVPVPAP